MVRLLKHKAASRVVAAALRVACELTAGSWRRRWRSGRCCPVLRVRPAHGHCMGWPAAASKPGLNVLLLLFSPFVVEGVLLACFVLLI